MRHPVAHTGKALRLGSSAAVLALAAAALFGSAGPAAAGSGYGQLIVNPGTAAPGQSVSILGVCPTNGSTLSGVTSSAFAGGSASISLGSENFSGTATIGSVSPGTYVVTANCGSGSPSVDITVSSGGTVTTTAPVATMPAATQPAMSSPTVTHSSAQAMTSAPAPMTGGAGTGGSSMKSSGPASMSAKASPTSSTLTALGFPADTSTTAAPAVTSTGVIRVGLAGQSSQLSAVLTPVLLALVFATACGAGFLLHRRRRHNAASHN